MRTDRTSRTLLCMSAVKYAKFDEARAHLKDLLDAAAVGRAAVIERSSRTTAFVDRDLLVEQLRRLLAADFQLAADGDRWLAAVAGTPVAGEGDTADESVDDLIDALRDYAEDWGERLRHAPNHRSAWPLVQLVDLSEDDELHAWIVGTTSP